MIDLNLLLNSGAVYKEINANEIIFKEGTYAQFYYQLVSGSVRCVNRNEHGNDFLQWMVEPGECFGELALCDSEPLAVTAIANEDSLVIRLHESIFKKLLSENPEIYNSLTALLCQRLRFKSMVFREMANHNPEHSIATLINYFKNNSKYICSSCNKLKLTRQQIADMTGLRVETVIRVIRNLQIKGKLTIEKGKVYC